MARAIPSTCASEAASQRRAERSMPDSERGRAAVARRSATMRSTEPSRLSARVCSRRAAAPSSSATPAAGTELTSTSRSTLSGSASASHIPIAPPRE